MSVFSSLFVDSSAFVSIGDESESRHDTAVSFFASLPTTTKMVTTNFVLDETITRLRRLVGVARAYEFGFKTPELPNYRIIWLDKNHYNQALEKFRKFEDKNFSFTDCTSFVLMEEMGIRDAFAFDEDFRRAGFRVHPE